MQAVGQSQGFGVLLNIGLVSTAGGRAILSHQAFQEFGISLRMLHSIRANDARSFLGSGPSDFVYQLVSGGVTRNDEAQLVHWLSECDKRVRRRALKILRYGASSPALDLITSELETEKSTEVWAASVYTLIAHHDERFLETVFSSLEHLSPQRQRILARAFRSSNHHGYVTWAIRLAEERKRHSLTVSAFEISLRANAIKEADRLADLYLVQALSTRRKLCRLFNEHRTGSLAEVLSIRLLPFELSAELLTYLLNRIGNHLNDSPPAHLIHACSVLSEVKNLDKNARRRLRSIAASLKQPGEGSDVNQHLLSLCEDLGRYRKKLI